MQTREVRVLDHGFVRLVDIMGDDKAIVDAARLSIAGQNARPVSEDRALIRYLLRHRHTTPFEMVVFKFHVKAPIFVVRQWWRHRMASINEMSARYSELPEEFYVPEPSAIQFQAGKNKQGRAGIVMDDAIAAVANFNDEARMAFGEYRERLDDGMARELARINLPLSTYTEAFWKIDLHNLFHFLGLRLDKHAQMEIRVYAEALAKMVEESCPLAWEAFSAFRLNAMSLSQSDVAVLRDLIKDSPAAAYGTIRDALADRFVTKREADEFFAKLDVLVGRSE